MLGLVLSGAITTYLRYRIKRENLAARVEVEKMNKVIEKENQEIRYLLDLE